MYACMILPCSLHWDIANCMYTVTDLYSQGRAIQLYSQLLIDKNYNFTFVHYVDSQLPICMHPLCKGNSITAAFPWYSLQLFLYVATQLAANLISILDSYVSGTIATQLASQIYSEPLPKLQLTLISAFHSQYSC